MSIQKVSNLSANRTIIMSGNAQDDNPSAGEWLTAYVIENPYANTKASNAVKTGVFISTLAGVATAMYMTFRAKKLRMDNLKDFFTHLKTVKYEKEKHEVEWLVGRLAVGSVGGGLIGGAILDKKDNFKAKAREAVVQLVGNIAIPLGCVAGGLTVYEKYFESKVVKALKLGEKTKGIPGVILSIGCLVAGVFSGNKTGNFINKEVFGCEEKRTLKVSDMSPHIDDLGVAAAFVVPKDKPVGAVIARIIPAALMIAGISTGVAQEKHKPTVKTVMFKKSEVNQTANQS